MRDSCVEYRIDVLLCCVRTPLMFCSHTMRVQLDGLGTREVRDKFRAHVKKAGDSYDLVGSSGHLWGVAYKATDEVGQCVRLVNARVRVHVV
jgi:hypothetical protein